MNRRDFLARCLIGGVILGFGGEIFDLDYLKNFYQQTVHSAENENYYRIVVMGDPHLPVRTRKIKSEEKQQKILLAKQKVIKDINDWDDVGEIAVLGDIAAQFGNDEEYNFAKKYFSPLGKPIYFITGNHDYVYKDMPSAEGVLVHGNAAQRQQKLERFRNVFGMDALYYSHEAGRYRLIYLSPNSLTSPYLTEINKKQLAWLKEELTRHEGKPTLVFFHAPLKDTLLSYNKSVNTPNFITQPESEIHTLLQGNQQIVLWVSGHTHTPATNASYADNAVNTYDGHVRNIHTPDMDRETIWTNSLYLYDDKIEIRTYNHKTDEWVDCLDRTIFIDEAGHMKCMP